MKLLIVEWWDHTGDAGWVDKPEKMKPSRCKTIGWLVNEDKDAIRLADTISDEGTEDEGVGGISLILKACIIKRTRVHP